jgi:P27 family predicted phage terminase small subunit
MGKRGPKPKPTALRLLAGNPSRRPINEDEPVVAAPLRKSSLVLSDEIASDEWDRVVKSMPPDLYTAADAAILSDYAIAWSIFVRSWNDIQEHGQLVQRPIYDFTYDANGTKSENRSIVGYELKENPAMRSWAKAHQIILQTTDRLGLSPGVRSRLSIPNRGAVKEERSKFAGLIGRDQNE